MTTETTNANPKMAKLNWNGKEIEAPVGSNLLKAALDNKIEVAHYCYHSGLSVAGVCRMCMVEQEGVPRMYPACNATVQDGMKIKNDTESVKKAVEWTLQLHLVNHPLDCPICDQAGECGLQDYYMKHGVYDSSMIDHKVHKDKVQDIGRGVMLDAERCILCSRCVRFTDEVTKTHEMGIVNRGDHAEIVANETLKNDYAANLVDICPVGALTSKDFRFKQRVWFLEEVNTSCIGCDTLCSVKAYQNKSGTYRVKPVFDEKVNGHWMCDDGRDIYKHVSRADRLQSPLMNRDGLFLPTELETVLSQAKGKNIKFILNASLTNQEYEMFFSLIKNSDLKNISVALYRNPNIGPEFDGILKRGNKNPNLKGALKYFGEYGFDASAEALDKMLNGLSEQDALFVAFPEFYYEEDHLNTLAKKSTKAGLKLALTPNDGFYALRDFDYLLPVPAFLEKEGTMTNFQGIERTLNKGRHFGAAHLTVASYLNYLC